MELDVRSLHDGAAGMRVEVEEGSAVMERERPRKLLRGVIPALVTPFDTEGRLALGSVPALVDHLIEAGVGGLFVAGNTGEVHFLSVEERKSLAEAVVQAARRRVPVIVHVGGPVRTEACVELAVHAAAIGADATAGLLPPEVETLEEAVEHFSAVGGATHLPFYVHWLDNDTVTPERFLEAMSHVPNFTGVKFTSSDLYAFQRLVDLSGETTNALTGPDQMFVAGLAMGSDGAVGSSYNVMPGLYAGIMEAFERGDTREACRLQMCANRVIALLVAKCNSGNFCAGIKAMLRWRGIDVGEPRDASLRLDPQRLEELRAELLALDFVVR